MYEIQRVIDELVRKYEQGEFYTEEKRGELCIDKVILQDKVFGVCKLTRSNKKLDFTGIEIYSENNLSSICINLESRDLLEEYTEYILSENGQRNINELAEELKDTCRTGNGYIEIYCDNIKENGNKIRIWFDEMYIESNTDNLQGESLHSLVVNILHIG